MSKKKQTRTTVKSIHSYRSDRNLKNSVRVCHIRSFIYLLHNVKNVKRRLTFTRILFASTHDKMNVYSAGTKQSPPL